MCFVTPVSAYTFLKDDMLIEKYQNYIISNAWDTLRAFSIEKKLEILDATIPRVQNYYNSDVSEQQKKIAINMLYAIEDYLEDHVYEEDSTAFWKDIVIRVIDDRQCKSCNTNSMVQWLREYHSLRDASISYKDFSDEGVSKFLRENEIDFLPAIIFNSNLIKDYNQITPYLKKIENGEYMLEVWASFDPFQNRSEQWFFIINMETISQIQDNSYILWNKDAKIIWLKYWGLEEPFSAKLHNDRVLEKVQENYPNNVQFIFNHFPLEFHPGSMSGAEILECAAEQQWAEAFYDIYSDTFETYKWFSIDIKEVIQYAYERWISADTLVDCMTEDRYIEKIQLQMQQWQDLFSINGTPWNVLINTQTWEYTVISWAYPYGWFAQEIDKLLIK